MIRWERSRFAIGKRLSIAFSLSAGVALAGLFGTMNCSQASVGLDESVAVVDQAITLTDYSVLTSHNDMYRRGGQAFETVLTPAIVPNLRELATFPPIGCMRGTPQCPAGAFTAQPLLFRGISNGTPRDALVVVTNATTTPSLYFLDAKSLHIIQQLSLPGLTTKTTANGGVVGAMSTPVIDRTANVLYLVVANDVGGTAGFNLMAFNISNLNAVTLLGSRRIAGSCPSETFTAVNADGNLIQQQRPGLLLNVPVNDTAPGYVYIAFGSIGVETIRYNGWVFAYHGYIANNPNSLMPVGTPYCSSRSVPGIGQPIGRGGIFQFGAGLAADDTGNVYFATGNGPQGPNDDGDSYMKLAPALPNTWSKFPDPNSSFLAFHDLDLSSAGVVLLPASITMRLLGTGKQGLFTVLNATGMSLVSRVRAAWNQGTPMLGDPTHLQDGEIACTDEKCLSSPGSYGIPSFDGGQQCCPLGCTSEGACGPATGDIIHGSMPHIHGTPAYLATSSTTGMLFWWGEKDYPRFASWNAGTLSPMSNAGNRLSNDPSDLAPTNREVTDYNQFQQAAMPSGLGSVSSNGTSNGVFWANVPQGNGMNGADNGTGQSQRSWLKAFDAVTFPKPHLVQMDLGGQETHSYPTIANGTVYVAGGAPMSGRIKAFRADLVDLFWANSAKQLRRQRYAITGGTFEPAENIASGMMGSTPQPLAAGNGVLETFWRGTDNNLWHNWYNPTVSSWQTSQQVITTTGNLASDPLAIAPRAEALDVFWKGSDSALWHAYYIPGSPWSSAESLGSGPLGSPPHPVATGAGVEHVFWSGTDGNLWHNWLIPGNNWQPSPQNLTSLPGGHGGLLSVPPMPISQSPGSIDVFWKGADNNLWHAQFDGTTWVNAPQIAQSLGCGPLGSAPHPIASGSGVEDVFWRGTDNNLWHTWFVPGVGWQASAQKLTTSASVVSEPYPTTLHNGAIDVFWLDGSGKIQHLGYVPGTGWATTPNTNGTATTGSSTPQPI